MLRLEVYLLSLCLLLSSSNFLSPEAEAMKITGRNTGQESENDNLDTKHINTMYNTIQIFEKYTQFLRNNQDLPKHSKFAQNNIQKKYLFATIIIMFLLFQKFNKVIQDVMDILPPLVQEKEPELSPELKEAKGLYDAALLTLNRRTPDLYRVVYKVRLPRDIIEYILAKMKLAWSYLTGEGLEWELEMILADLHGAMHQVTQAANIGYVPAKIKLAWSYLFGENGLGFLYATGIAVPVSQAKALVHYTMGAIGDSDFAQMALAYRYWSGNTVRMSCLKAMDLYMRVASKVISYVEGAGPGTIDSEILDSDTTSTVEYYRRIAEKRYQEKQAQVFQFLVGASRRIQKQRLNILQWQPTKDGQRGSGNLGLCTSLFRNVSERGSWATRMVDAHESVYPQGVDSAILQHLALAERGYSSQQRIAAVLLDTSNHRLSNGPELKALYHQLRTRSKVPRQEQSVHPYNRLSRDDSIYSCRAEKELIYAESRA
ncbi:hypothetical protein HF086_013530 [Spodoptera exigua]|uniref:Uncharacterized protein n=1 Tax=Spodoptera exigua TaxID=7107 RepID=A0A922MUQ4_SPOEX|nr:hypothetical protein HF086_013530 [Spodoptera exigua]